MRRRPGVDPYEGPDKEYAKRLKEKLAGARFIVKYLATSVVDSEFQIFAMVVEKTTGQRHIFVARTESGKS